MNANPQHVAYFIGDAVKRATPSKSSTPSTNEEVEKDFEKGICAANLIQSEKQDSIIPEPVGPPAPDHPPDGGFEAWVSVLGAFCGLFVSFGWINCIGVFQTYYERHQLSNMSTSTVTWITSLETFIMFFTGPIFGTLFDNFGPRYILLGGTFFHVFGLMMASLSTKYYQFILAQGICSPLGASAIFNVSLNSVNTWFTKRRAFALGVTASGSSLGGVIFPIVVLNLIPRVGFPWTMRICALLICSMLGVSNLTLKSRLKHTTNPFDIVNFIHPMKDMRFVLTVSACFCFCWGMFLPYTFVITQAERYGMSEQLSAYLIPILNAASIFGRTLPGYIADRVGRYNVMIFFSYVSAILVLGLWLPSHASAPTVVFSALYGFSSGAFVSLTPALIAQISAPYEFGVRTGTCFSVISFATLTGAPIGGALVPDVLTDSYTRLQVFCGTVMLAGATLFVIARIAIRSVILVKV